MKAFVATIQFEAAAPLHLHFIATDWLVVHTSALELFWPCAVSVRLA